MIKLVKIFSIFIVAYMDLIHAQAFNAHKQNRIIVDSSFRIYKDENIIPSGTWGKFNGSEKRITSLKRSKSLNLADKLFGKYLYSVYDTYCLKKFFKKNCLGEKLNIQFSLTGTGRLHSKKILIKLNGKSFRSQRFHQTTVQFLNYLSKNFGDAGFTKLEKKILFPSYQKGIRLNFHTVLPKLGFGKNNQWQHEAFLLGLIEYMNKKFNMENHPFILNSVKTYRNGGLYNEKNLTNVWWEFVDEGEKGLKKYNYKSTQKQGEVSIIVAGPGKRDANGSYEQGNTSIGRYSSPSVAIRNSSDPAYDSMPWTDPDLFYEYTDIILHEIGHNTLALEHGPPGPGGDLNANNILFHKVEFSRKLKEHMKKIGGLKRTPIWRY